MSSSAKTDRQLSIRSSEYLWDGADDPGALSYLLPPILETLHHARAQAVLDLGCGNGALASHLATAGYEVTGCDQSASGVELAQRNVPSSSFFRQDLSADLPARHCGRYDAVVSTEVIEHLLLPRRLLENARAALKPGGLFLVTTPYHGYWKNLALALTDKFDEHWHPLRDYGHVKFFSRRTLTQLFDEAGFARILSTTAGRIPPLARSLVVSGVKAS